MKRLLVLLLVLGFVFSGLAVAEARGRRCKQEVKAEENFNVAGVKVDAPNLIKIGKGWTLGAEGGKNVIKNIFHNDNAYYEADKGYFAYVKVTYAGCLLNCKQKGE